jgi:lysophospholipase L1-like esterase
MNKKGEGGLDLINNTVVRILLGIVVLVVLWSVTANLLSIFISDEADATVRNYDRLVATINAMEDDDYFMEYPVYLKETFAIVGWQQGESANSGTCTYGEGKITLEGLPKPPACGVGEEGCICLCTNSADHSTLCQEKGSIVKCSSLPTGDLKEDLSFIGCAEKSEHTCDFAILLGDGHEQAVFLDKDDTLIELSLTACDANRASESSSTDYGSYVPTSSQAEAFAQIDANYGELIDSSVEGTSLTHALMVGLIYQESGGNPNAESSTYCYGIMQFCSSTAYAYGLCDVSNCKGERDDRGDPTKAIPAGVALMDALVTIFDSYSSEVEFSLGSYNGGESVVKKGIARTGSSDPSWSAVSAALTWEDYPEDKKYFDTQEKREAKINEIRNYVTAVLSHAAKYETWKATQSDTECGYNTVVVIGASNTVPGYSYVHLLQQRCSGTHFINAGENGHGPGDQLARFDDDVLAHNPDVVIISPSGNNYWESDYTDNVVAMAEEAQKNGAKVAVLAVSPRADMASQLTTFNTALLENHLSSDAITYAIDAYTPLLEDSEEIACGFCTDGVHWTNEGHEIVADAVWEKVFMSTAVS